MSWNAGCCLEWQHPGWKPRLLGDLSGVIVGSCRLLSAVGELVQAEVSASPAQSNLPLPGTETACFLITFMANFGPDTLKWYRKRLVIVRLLHIKPHSRQSEHQKNVQCEALNLLGPVRKWNGIDSRTVMDCLCTGPSLTCPSFGRLDSGDVRMVWSSPHQSSPVNHLDHPGHSDPFLDQVMRQCFQLVLPGAPMCCFGGELVLARMCGNCGGEAAADQI